METKESHYPEHSASLKEKEVEEDNDPLCCCEYYNRDNERFHILGCCCNCVDCDSVFDSLICCKPVEESRIGAMLLTFQDRLRIPWRGGAKQISLDSIIPVIVIPIVIGIAAINFYSALIMCGTTPAFLGYAYYYLRRIHPRSKFFFMWTFWSIVYLVLLFEFTVPLMELLPEENYILVAFVAVSLFCMYKTKKKARLNFVVQSLSSEDDLPDIAEEQTSVLLEHDELEENAHANICQKCRKYVQPRTFHCAVCQACIMRRDHHSFWLDCCIGEANHRFYLAGLWFGVMALTLGANLTMTSVCHPFLLFRVFGVHVLFPDDCSEVFDQYEMSLAFIVSVYALLISIFVLTALFMQIYLIAKGITLTEWRQGQTGNRRSVYGNVKAFVCWMK